MEKIGSLGNIRYRFILEQVSLKDLQESSDYKYTDKHRQVLYEELKTIGKSRQIDQILEAEKLFLLNDQSNYIGSSAQGKAIANALSELAAASNAYQKVLSPDSYKEINDNLQSHKSRSGDLPLDEARQFFKSNSVRILNWDKGKMSVSERSILEARKANMLTAQTIYIGLQRKALGLEDKVTKEQALTR